MNKLAIAITSNIIEWFEFTISAYFAVTLGSVFFHNQSELSSALQIFTVFALSYLARPIGCLIFGYYSDTRSAAKSLRLSLLFMAIPTVVIAVMPTFNQIGLISSALFLLLRVIQGIAAGGEFPINSVFIYRLACESKHKRLICSLANVSGMIGMFIASAVATVVLTLFSKQQIIEWAWRIPFLLTIPLSGLVFYFRTKLKDVDRKTEVLISQSKIINPIVKTVMLISFVQVGMYILFVWMPTYQTIYLGYDKLSVQRINTCALIFLAILTTVWGYLADKLDYVKVVNKCTLVTVLLILPLFYLLSTEHNLILMIVIQFGFAVLISPLQGVFIYTINEYWKGHSWNSLGLSLTYTIPSSIFGGVTPILCAYLIGKYSNLMIPGVVIFVIGLIQLLSNLTKKMDSSGQNPERL